MAKATEQDPFHAAPTALRIIGIGQESAGDDGVGLRVIAALKARPWSPGVELHTVRDPADLIELMEDVDSVIVIDALVGRPAGSIHVLDLDNLSLEPQSGLSSHGLGVAQAVALARAVLERPARELKIVAVGIEPPQRHSTALSPAVSAAVERAAEVVLELTSRGG